MTAPSVTHKDAVLRHGRAAVAYQSLEAGIQFLPFEDGGVAYFDTGRAWVSAGPPLVAPDAVARAGRHFAEVAAAAGRRSCLFALEEPLASDADHRPIAIGRQPVWNPQSWQTTLRAKRSLREQLRRARAKGLSVIRTTAKDASAELLSELHSLVARWQASRAMAPMGFLVDVDLSAAAGNRRLIVAMRDGRPIGLLAMVPIPAIDGWLFEDVIRDPSAVNGTVEWMFDQAMQWSAESGCQHVTYGMAPLAEVESKPLRAIARVTRPLFDFRGLETFKRKLMPDAWQTVYLATPRGTGAARSILDVLTAFAGGSLLRFAGRTLLHRASAVVLLLALLLVPWTALLAAAPAHWFPGELVRWGWVAIDCALLLGLLSFAKRPRRWLAGVLTTAIAFDLTGGVIQLAAHNVRTVSGIDWLFVVLALVAPATALVFFVAWRRSPHARQ